MLQDLEGLVAQVKLDFVAPQTAASGVELEAVKAVQGDLG
jgi:hypothetical protein